ncbi:MAG: formimidoylglutamase [Bacteroidales bacterium]|jgi:arginase family enzyme|nr:formimidoylglutamase [Bacteroidales bacterium]
MSISQYLSPIQPDSLGYYPSEFSVTLGSRIIPYHPGDEIPEHSLVLLGVGEDRGAEYNAGCGGAPDEIRRYLYQLAIPHSDTHITDLGNIILGQTAADTYYAVAEIVADLLAEGHTLVLLGGSQDLTFAAYKGYENLHSIINIASIDSRFDLENNDDITSRTWLRNIIMQNPNYLFFNSNIGYQTHFVGQDHIRLMDDLKFDAYRIGEVQQDMSRAEALIRNSDLLSVDIGAIRQSDAPANGYPSPHGFYGEEFCQMMRFAGMSNKTNCLGLFEVNPLFDNHGQTAHMVAQGLWYFIEGFYLRKHDNPLIYPENCKHFIVKMEEPDLDIHFYKSKLSDRWWVHVPCHDSELQEIYSTQLMLPCTYAEYLQAMKGEVPALWMKYYQRLNS